MIKPRLKLVWLRRKGSNTGHILMRQSTITLIESGKPKRTEQEMEFWCGIGGKPSEFVPLHKTTRKCKHCSEYVFHAGEMKLLDRKFQ